MNDRSRKRRSASALGESLEIGEIVELIPHYRTDEGANAAIQAASAGEANRVFSVVAEEVQRLPSVRARRPSRSSDRQDHSGGRRMRWRWKIDGRRCRNAKLSDAAGQALAGSAVSRELSG
jgi:hypothetical protein